MPADHTMPGPGVGDRGSGVWVRVLVGGTGVLVGGTEVLVGGTGVLVGGTGVLVAGTEVLVGGTGVLVGATGVFVAAGVAVPDALYCSTLTLSRSTPASLPLMTSW